jgi:hypothetical protein
MSGTIPPLPPYAFVACSVKKKQRDNFTFIRLIKVPLAMKTWANSHINTE